MDNDISWMQRHNGRFYYRRDEGYDRSSSYTIFKEGSGCYSIYKAVYIAGPFDTLDAAKTAYLLIDQEEFT